LDDPAFRAAKAGTVAAVLDATFLTLTTDPETFKRFREAVGAVGLGLSKPKLESALKPELTNLVTQQAVLDQATAMQASDIWMPLAQLISTQIFAAEGAVAPQSEVECLHWSLLAAFFQGTRIPDATRLGNVLRNCLSRGRFNIRGSLLRLIEKTDGNGIADPPVPHVDYAPIALTAAHQSVSELLASVSLESTKVPANQGVMLTCFAEVINNPPVIPPSTNPLITPQMVIDSRVFRYQQYEYAALGLSAIAATEFLLRTATERSAIEGLDARYAGQMDMVKKLPITPDLRDELASIFDANGPNVRNRSLHGGFLEIESKRTDLVMASGIGAAARIPALNLDKDLYLPRNAAAIALRAIARLDAELAGLALIDPASLTWTQHFHLTGADLAFAVALDEPTFTILEQDRKVTIKYIQDDLPCLSMPVQLGIYGWVRPKHSESLAQLFAFLSVMFEPTVRLILQAAGFHVLQRSPHKGKRLVRYRMLDDNSLIADAILQWIEDGVPAAEKADCRKTIKLAVRCRDAFAHGAVVTFDAATRKAYGALLTKSLYLIITAARTQGI
jgi:hypothetical protein